MHKIIKSSVKKVKQEIKSYLLKPKDVKYSNKAKDNVNLFNRGKEFAKEILFFKTNKKSSEIVLKNKKLLEKENLKSLLTFIFSDFSMDQIEDMIRYFFGNLTQAERENVLEDIINHINEKEYGFLLKD